MNNIYLTITGDRSTGTAIDYWRPVQNGTQEPDECQKALMQVVQKALDAGLFYNVDVDRYVREHNDFIPPEKWELQFTRHPVENGVMGFEVYLARKAIEERKIRAENEAAVKLYHVGQKIGTLYLNGKRSNALVVTDIKDIAVVLVGKMGTSTVQWTVNARAIAPAKERAIQRGWCKS